MLRAYNLDRNGWSIIRPSADTRKVYVSTSGNDANDGLSEGAPKATIAAGKALLRAGYPDWLLLKCGDTWTEAFGQFAASGRSARERIHITSYGTGDRPILRTGASSGFETVSGNTRNFIAITNIRVDPHTYDGTNGTPTFITLLGNAKDILIEGCYVAEGEIGYSSTGTGQRENIQLRRNIAYQHYRLSGSVGHGIYMSGVTNLLIEENILDHNGWHETNPNGPASTFRHNIYITHACFKVLVRNNIITKSASHGIQMRCDGTMFNNLFLKNSISIFLGAGDEPRVGGYEIKCSHNVVLNGKNIDGSNPRGHAMGAKNISSGHFKYNLIAHNIDGDSPVLMDLDGTTQGNRLNNFTISNNVSENWGGNIQVYGASGDQLTGTSIRNNKINIPEEDFIITYSTSGFAAGTVGLYDNTLYRATGNSTVIYTTTVGSRTIPQFEALFPNATGNNYAQNTFTDNTRTIETYASTMLDLSGTLDAYLDQCRMQSMANWRPNLMPQTVNPWIRAGYDIPEPSSNTLARQGGFLVFDTQRVPLEGNS